MTIFTAVAASSISCSGRSWSSRRRRCAPISSSSKNWQSASASIIFPVSASTSGSISTASCSPATGAATRIWRATNGSIASRISTTAHYIKGFGYPDGKFRFRPDWANGPSPDKPPKNVGPLGPIAELPVFPDHVDVIEVADEAHPFRLATSPARSFLNSSFSETKSSYEREGRPEVMIDADRCGAPRYRRRRYRPARQRARRNPPACEDRPAQGRAC
jgi:hypothetical protein